MKEKIDLTDFLALEPRIQKRFKIQDVTKFYRATDNAIKYKKLLTRNHTEEEATKLFKELSDDVKDLQRSLSLGTCIFHGFEFPMELVEDQEHALFGTLHTTAEEQKFSKVIRKRKID